MRVEEGGIELEIPGESTEGIEEAVFYNPRQELNRDITIGVLRAMQTERPALETYLDAMTASGVRGIRSAADGWTVTCCDRSQEAVALTSENLELNGFTPVEPPQATGSRVGVVRRDAAALMRESHFDVVDLDPFGSPMSVIDAAVSAADELLCVTATDTAPLCGAHLASGIRSYGAVPRNTEYHPEMGVRILLGALVRSGARFDVALTPVLTHATSHYVRTYLELDHRATAADEALESLGYLTHCRDCLHRSASQGLVPVLEDRCSACGSETVTHAGPLWLDSTHDRTVVAGVREELPDSFGSAETARRLLTSLESELHRPTHYDQHVLCKQWGLPANAMDEFLEAIEGAGFDTSRTHYGGTTFKTDATVDQIREATIPDLERAG
ncbi:MAG: tRNA (guanine(26)-N(2))-dimethyltransferase [Natrialbaceae archaeon]|nr:tRNA (guanine(26)-N(2))-dimethyltransferase [Natrialbaceae archaeon]